MTTKDRPDKTPEYCTYETFGREFFVAAITPERIIDGMSGLVGRPVDIGPVGAGPGRMAKVTAKGEVGDPQVRREPGTEPLRFITTLPIGLDLVIAIGGQRSEFRADMVVTLRMAARAAHDLRVVIDVDPPRSADVELNLRAGGFRAAMLQQVAGIDDEIRRFVARHIRKELERPAAATARVIDIGAIVSAARR